MSLIKSMLKKAQSQKKEAEMGEATEEMLDKLRISVLESINKNFQLGKHKVTLGLFYVPYFLNKDTSKLLLDCIEGMPQDKWDVLPHARRRLQKWGRTSSYSFRR